MYEVSRSGRQSKKWQVKTPSGKTVHFGASGYEDYTQHTRTRGARATT